MPFIITKPLDEQKQEFISEVNSIAGVKITDSYPLYKQINLGRLPDSAETIAMYSFIDSVRNASNTASASINSASSITEIRVAVDQFKETIANL